MMSTILCFFCYPAASSGRRWSGSWRGWRWRSESGGVEAEGRQRVEKVEKAGGELFFSRMAKLPG